MFECCLRLVVFVKTSDILGQCELQVRWWKCTLCTLDDCALLSIGHNYWIINMSKSRKTRVFSCQGVNSLMSEQLDPGLTTESAQHANEIFYS